LGPLVSRPKPVIRALSSSHSGLPEIKCPKQPTGALRLPMAWAIRWSGEPAYTMCPPVVLPTDPANRFHLPFQRVEVVRFPTPGGGSPSSSAEADSVPVGPGPRPSSPPIPLRRPPAQFLRPRLRRAVARFPGSPVPRPPHLRPKSPVCRCRPLEALRLSGSGGPSCEDPGVAAVELLGTRRNIEGRQGGVNANSARSSRSAKHCAMRAGSPQVARSFHRSINIPVVPPRAQ
jgi:hypothetical protein